MESYRIISSIKINGTEIVSQINGLPIFERQGSADGACGPYSLFITLKILGELTKEDIDWPDEIKKSRCVYKFMGKIEKMKGLVVNGTVRIKLRKLIEENFKSKLNVLDSKLNNEELIAFVINELKEDRPTIVGVEFHDGGHWMVAVGYSMDEKEKPIKLLLIDPSGEEPTFSPWNSVIEIGRKRRGDYPYHWHTKGYNISFDEALSVWRK